MRSYKTPKKSEAAKIPSFTAVKQTSAAHPPNHEPCGRPKGQEPSYLADFPSSPEISEQSGFVGNHAELYTAYIYIHIYTCMYICIYISIFNKQFDDSWIIILITHHSLLKLKKNLKIREKYPKSTKAQVDWSLEVIALLSLVLKGLVLVSMAKSLENPGNFKGCDDETMWENLQKISWMKGDMLKIGCFLVVENRNILFLYGKC